MSKKVYLIIKYLFFFILLFILGFAKIGGLSNFAFAMYFCLIWCGQSILVLSPMYLLSSFLHAFNTTELICAGITVAVIVSFYFLHYKFKKPFNTFLIMLYGFLSQVAFMYMHSQISSEFFDSVLSVVLGLIFLYCSLHLFQNILLKGLRRKFFVDEGICAGVVVAMLASGLYNMPFGEYIYAVVSVLCLMVVIWCFGMPSGILCGTLFGLGVSLCTQNIGYIVRMVLLAISAGTMKTNKRVFSVIAVILTDIFIDLYLMPVYVMSSIIGVCIGALIFLILPQKVLKYISSLIITEGQNNALYEMLERQRKQLQLKLSTMSNVFFEIKNTYLNMVKKCYTSDDVYNIVNTQILQTICSKCPNKDLCINLNNQETNYHIQQLSKQAYTRGRVNIAEVEPNFAKGCVRLPVVVSAINHNIDEYKHTMFDIQSNNEYKLMMAEQLFGVSQIFKTMSSQLSTKLVFDIEKENEIIEVLSKNHILCTECLVYKDEADTFKVSLNIRNRDIINECIERVITQCLNTKMQVHSIVHSTIKNHSIIILKPKNVYEIVFGCAGASKHNMDVSGDTHSVIKITSDQILLSICDGMGSGKTAEDMSRRSVSLIENFYKAGFDSSTTLKVVNNLLSQRGEDSFSAIDLGIINLHTGILNLYKVGAPCSFLKKANGVDVLESGALPLGIINDARPHIQSVVLCDGDYLILVSDGVLDSVNDIDKIKEIINNIQNTNPQAVANELLSAVLKLSNNLPQDDMTVLVGRLIKN